MMAKQAPMSPDRADPGQPIPPIKFKATVLAMKDDDKLSFSEIAQYTGRPLGVVIDVYYSAGGQYGIKDLPESVRALKIEKIPLSIRAYNVLARNNLRTVGAVLDRVQKDRLLTLRRLGMQTLEIILDILESLYAGNAE